MTAAAMIAWLVSAENSFATGAVFDLSGNRSKYRSTRPAPSRRRTQMPGSG
jgi:hypothetical protein